MLKYSFRFQFLAEICPVYDGWGLRVAIHVKMFLFGSIMVLFEGPICHCIWEVPVAIIKEMFFMNEALTDEYELTTRRRGESSLLTRTDLGWYTWQWWPWLTLPCLIFLRTVTQKHTMLCTQISTGTLIHSISLKCLVSWSFSSSVDWCWGETVIREKQERPGMLSSLVSSLGFDIL